jgi:catalase
MHVLPRISSWRSALPETSPHAAPSLGSFALIAVIIAAGAAAFAYTAGWFSPNRLNGDKLVAVLAPPSGPALGHRRNHAKGICFTGVFDSNGNGAAISSSQIFARGEYPAIGRFNLATPNAYAQDAMVRVRGLGLQISTPTGEVWRAAMIDPPFFPVATVEGFYALQLASKSKDPNAMGSFVAAHPEIKAFGGWAKSAPWTASYAEEPYNSLNAFIFTDNSGAEHAVRWSYVPQAQAVPISPADLAKRGPNYLEQEIAERVGKAPQRWTLTLTVADPSDQTSDPSKVWPKGRRTIDAGVLVVQKIEAEADGPCRDINFDPTILPNGAHVSDDPFPAARSAAYAKSFDLRTSEAKYYPYTQPSPQP